MDKLNEAVERAIGRDRIATEALWQLDTALAVATANEVCPRAQLAEAHEPIATTLRAIRDRAHLDLARLALLVDDPQVRTRTLELTTREWWGSTAPMWLLSPTGADATMYPAAEADQLTEQLASAFATAGVNVPAASGPDRRDFATWQRPDAVTIPPVQRSRTLMPRVVLRSLEQARTLINDVRCTIATHGIGSSHEDTVDAMATLEKCLLEGLVACHEAIQSGGDTPHVAVLAETLAADKVAFYATRERSRYPQATDHAMRDLLWVTDEASDRFSSQLGRPDRLRSA